ncbi:PIG-L family deacetylase [Pelomonas sp. APW6]|uniref:PIG-L family deacetylase n=1 Tax=Roseateles subflavus TaxID=3053353 RepID=A0ABT7LM77_9BURK|nr:PIG-L family deacetylase [Pelomonas sp. APW6]MDL5033357.1 PIG-L family deacetylase [Pelomonas sp. APW6]
MSPLRPPALDADDAQEGAQQGRLPATEADRARELADWLAWVDDWAQLMQLPPCDEAAPARKRRGHTPLALIFSPHPDDECIVGALPLRLRRESHWRVCNVAVTLGSNQARRQPRWQELRQACALLDFETLQLAEGGLEQVRPDTPIAQPGLWQGHVDQAAALLRREQPALVLLPHEGDGIATHMGVHRLALDALQAAGYNGLVAQTEYWAPQSGANLMVESSRQDLARLVQALSRHEGEVARNPYHLRLPAWMADNVRRGGEMIAGAGTAPPAFGFATLYRLTRWLAGREQDDLPPRMAGAAERLSLA